VDDPTQDPEYMKAATTILCDCGCHPQSVHDCACGRAAEMRDEIAAMVAVGRTGDEVIAHYVAKRGEQIRIAPVARGFNLVAWIGPLLALLAASLGVAWVARRWSRAPAPAGGAPAPEALLPERPEDEAYRRRLQQAVDDRP